jgi:hypothetical protein
MHDQQGLPKREELLKSLLERLVSPDVTLPEAKLIRSQVMRILSENCPELDHSTLGHRKK